MRPSGSASRYGPGFVVVAIVTVVGFLALTAEAGQHETTFVTTASGTTLATTTTALLDTTTSSSTTSSTLEYNATLSLGIFPTEALGSVEVNVKFDDHNYGGIWNLDLDEDGIGRDLSCSSTIGDAVATHDAQRGVVADRSRS